MPNTKWFVGGKINASYNCLDRHLTTWRKNKAAIIWEGEPGDTRVLRYQDLHREVCRFANVLKKLGDQDGRPRHALHADDPRAGDRHAGLCADRRHAFDHLRRLQRRRHRRPQQRRPGEAGRSRPTAAGGAARKCRSKQTVDESLEKSPTVEKVVVVRRTGSHVNMVPDRDYWWHDLMAGTSAECDAAELDSEHPLFILYTSGSTGKPKGVLHTTAGYLLGTLMTSSWVFDLKDEDTYWCTADVGWVTGHSYIVYGPLANGATVVMYEGAPNWPDEGRFWQIIEKYQVNILYTAPTAIRAFVKWGDHWPAKYDLSSLRLLGSVGEPINPEAWMWYHRVIGRKRCPIVDTWWQTETGVDHDQPAARRDADQARKLHEAAARRRARHRRPSREPACRPTRAGFLVMRQPWPSMLRTLYGDHERFVKTYFSEVKGCYFTGDGARRDEDGYYWVMGRVDDVLNVAGHRLSTMEIESALVLAPTRGRSGRRRLSARSQGRRDLLLRDAQAGRRRRRAQGGAESPRPQAHRRLGHSRHDPLHATPCPKPAAAKIMRRLLRDIAAGREQVGDTTTLEDYGILAKLRQEEE